jgi:hypothetical protein
VTSIRLYNIYFLFARKKKTKQKKSSFDYYGLENGETKLTSLKKKSLRDIFVVCFVKNSQNIAFSMREKKLQYNLC